MTRLAVLLTVLLSCFCPAFLRADQQSDFVSAKLITDCAELKAGQVCRVGVLFSIQPDWHIYWKNPGDIGFPTEVNFSLPADFEVSEVLWPEPESFWQGGGRFLGYGYSGEVLLFAKVKIPASPAAGSSLTIRSKLKWLSCGPTMCVREKQQLSLELPAESKDNVRTDEFFATWEARLPLRADSPDQPCSIKDVASSGTLREGLDFSIRLSCGRAVEPKSWFPETSPRSVISDIKLQGKNGNYGLRFHLKPKDDGAVELGVLPSLLLFPGGQPAQELPLDLNQPMQNLKLGKHCFITLVYCLPAPAPSLDLFKDKC